MGSSAEGSSSRGTPTQDTASEDNPAIKHVNFDNFSLPTSRLSSYRQESANQSSSSQTQDSQPVVTTSNAEEFIRETLPPSSSQHDSAPGFSADKVEPDIASHGESLGETDRLDFARVTTSIGTTTDQAPPGPRKLTRSQKLVGMREVVLTAEQVDAENEARTARSIARIIAKGKATNANKNISPIQSHSNKSEPPLPIAEAQANDKGKKPENRSKTPQCPPPSSSQDEQKPGQSKRPPAHISPKIEGHSSTIQFPECQTWLKITLTSLGSCTHTHTSNPVSYRPSSSKQAEILPSTDENGTPLKSRPKPANFEGCQVCWEMVSNPNTQEEPPLPLSNEIKCCVIHCRCLDIFRGAAKKAWNVCLKGLKACRCFGACWKVIEEVPLVKERKKKREVRKGKMVDRSGTDGDGDGIELTDMRSKGKSGENEVDDSDVKSGEQTGESSYSQGVSGLGNDEQAAQGKQDMMMSRALNDGESGIEMANMVDNGKDKENEVDDSGVRGGEQLGERSGSQRGREQGEEYWSAGGDGVRL
ncbi:hypothetical protein V8E51_006088 [Hyaloscypha variabilis]